MARASTITEDDVAQAARDLLAAGRAPSVRLVRERLGRGSNTTIDAMLKRIRPLLPAAPSSVAPVPIAATVMVAPQVDVGHLAELEAQLGEERGRVAELRRQIEVLVAERDLARNELADAQAKVKTAKTEVAAANRVRDRAEEAVERESLARAAAEAQAAKAQRLMIADAAALARLRAYLECYGGTETLAQAEAGLAPADTDQLVAVARAARAEEACRPKAKGRRKAGA